MRAILRRLDFGRDSLERTQGRPGIAAGSRRTAKTEVQKQRVELRAPSGL